MLSLLSIAAARKARWRWAWWWPERGCLSVLRDVSLRRVDGLPGVDPCE
jgi:hypothetical protein